MRVIGLMGAERAGKSTVARFLREAHFTTVSFAGPIKAMLGHGLGLSHAQLHGSEKESPCPQLGGKTPRWAMQSLGTEWGREGIYDDIWVDAFKRDLRERERLSPGGIYLIEDVRFQNEIDAIHDLGGEIWLVRRPDVEPNIGWVYRLLRYLRLLPPLHASSMGWAYVESPEQVLWNIGTEEDLLCDVDRTLRIWMAHMYWKTDPDLLEAVHIPDVNSDAAEIETRPALLDLCGENLEVVVGQSVEGTLGVVAEPESVVAPTGSMADIGPEIESVTPSVEVETSQRSTPLDPTPGPKSKPKSRKGRKRKTAKS